MRIKSLELIGFKSFVDRTVVRFEDGITGIVGPNGSGKSNIVDAIRWVMGEQSAKHLRGGEMQDVIFAGSEKRSSLGMASVFLTFDNSDGRAPAEYSHYAEITVGRRLYRSGESEYFINKTPCRLKDIIDLFLGTGTGTKAYSIVEQGRIGQIVSSKPEERRVLIEEAAGISKFKNRREAAQRKMEATRANLVRLRDITFELERQLASLERQAKKAERHRALTNELRGLELASAAHQWQQLQSENSGVGDRLQSLNERETATAAELATVETGIETGRLQLAEIEREVASAQERAFALQNAIQLHEAKITHKTREIADTTARDTQAASEADLLTERLATWNTELVTARDTKSSTDQSLGASREASTALEIRAAEINRAYETVATSIRELQARVMRAVQRISAEESRTEHLQQRGADIAQQIARAETMMTELHTQRSALTETLTTDRTALQSRQQLTMQLGAERETTESSLAQQREEQRALEATLSFERDQLQLAQSRLQSLEELAKNFEGYEVGVREILQSRATDHALPGILGTVVQAVSTEPRFEAAVGAVLGERVQGVVVGAPEHGVSAIEFLKKQSKGRGTFIPREVRLHDGVATAVAGDGVLARMLDVVKFSDDFSAVGHYLLSDVVIVESLAHALNLWKAADHGVAYATLDGEILDAAGVMSGGSASDHAQAMLARKRELENLQPEVARLHTSVQGAELQRQRCIDRVQGLEAELARVSQNRHDEELRLVHQQKDVAHREQELTRLNREFDRQQQELQAHRALLVRLQEERATTQTTVDSAVQQRAEIEAQLAEQQQAGEELLRNRETVNQELAQRRAELASHEERARNAARDIERLEQSIVDAEKTIAQKRTLVGQGAMTVEDAQQELTGARAQLEVAVQEAAGAQQRQSAVQQKYHTLSAALGEQEASIRGLRKLHEELVREKHSVELSVTQQQERVAFLLRDVNEKYHLDLAAVANDYVREDFDEARVTAQVADLRDKVEKLGGVNTDAIAECQELQTRQEFLARQTQDLENSLDALQRAIQKINRISRDRFQETFTAINERFTQLFPKLFRGGKAELVLLDPDNALESGVEIIAQPPGKKLQNVMLLSGGEKALTAVAMIFAMFLVRPSPFCLLDEVDAPLDDANIDRFNDAIREMTQFAQFILITHNKRTMELADTLYGVTMEEPGISKLVSVKLGGREASPDVADETVAA